MFIFVMRVARGYLVIKSIKNSLKKFSVQSFNLEKNTMVRIDKNRVQQLEKELKGLVVPNHQYKK